jgi:hypothetical protein
MLYQYVLLIEVKSSGYLWWADVGILRVVSFRVGILRGRDFPLWVFPAYKKRGESTVRYRRTQGKLLSLYSHIHIHIQNGCYS